MDTNELSRLISLADYPAAEALLKQWSPSSTAIREELIEIGFDTESLAVYAFALYLLERCPMADMHYLAAEVLIGPLCHLEGAYHLALYHARCAAALAPHDPSFKEFLLLFYNIPEHLIAQKEAKELAEQVLAGMPDSVAAVRVLGRPTIKPEVVKELTDLLDSIPLPKGAQIQHTETRYDSIRRTIKCSGSKEEVDASYSTVLKEQGWKRSTIPVLKTRTVFFERDRYVLHLDVYQAPEGTYWLTARKRSEEMFQ